MKTMKFGIIGCGMISTVHAEVIKAPDNARLAAAEGTRIAL